jgi:hypothetical protein
VVDQSNQLDQTSKTNRTIGFGIAAIVAAFIVFTVVLWRAHFFTYTGTESSSKFVAQALTFVGGLVGAIVSILGILLKYSIDRQAEARLAVDSQHAAAMQQEAEKRLKLEAATKVIQLFGTSDGHEAPSTQIAGGLLTLASLGQHELAMVLTADLLQRKRIEASTACGVIEQALQQDSEEIQIDAIELLVEHTADMLTPSSLEIPMSILNWDLKLSEHVRGWAPIVLGDIMTKRPLSDWLTKDYTPDANTALAALALGWLHEPNSRLKNDVGAVLDCLLRAFPDSGELFHPKETIDTDKIRAELTAAHSSNAQVNDVLARLNKWIDDANAGAP